MKFAIIAAGEGSRLSHEGVAQPKPLVPLLGEPMIERLIRIFTACGATEIVVITNEQFVEVQQALACLQKTAPLRIVVKTTPSSMHSLHAISDYLRGEPFCLTTVDTIFHEDDFKKYIHHFLTLEELDGCMAVTPYVAGEKPLWVGADSHLHITGFHDAQEADDHLISGGIYCLKDKALDVLDHCMEKGLHRMRNFQRQLVAEGLNLEAYPIEKILDVDHKGDIDKAEAFLRQEGAMRLVGVCRSNVFSPNCVDSDLAIMHAVAAKLRDMGNEVRLCNENELKDCAALASADGFFNMGRSKEALAVLAQQEEQGKGVVNSARGIDSCIREKMSHLLIDNGVSYPKSWFIAHHGEMPADVSYPCWLKRGDGCAQQKEDTCYVQSADEAQRCLEDFWRRGVTSVVVNEHLKGDLMKFYGVRGTDFFYWFYPDRVGKSKFGLEVINGKAQGFKFDVEAVKAEVDKAGAILGVEVYGGDCVVAPNGRTTIIDFNDWPSFGPCRNQAAADIAQCVMQVVGKK